MDQYKDINNLLQKFVSVKKDKIINEAIYAPGYTLLKLRDLIETIGFLHVELLDQKSYIATIKGGFGKCNYASIAVGLKGDYVVAAAYADEGIINQHTSEDALNEIRTAIEKSRNY